MIVVPVSFGFVFWIGAGFAALAVFLWLVGLPAAIDRAHMARGNQRRREIGARRIIEENRKRQLGHLPGP
jgi:type IV secretory pathway TrbD component